jgi:hypothetical protein
MTRVVTIDLDSDSDVERLWQEYEKRAALRRSDPELRRSIERLAARMPEPDGDEVRAALEVSPPAVVLAAFFESLYQVSLQRPARERDPAPPVAAAPESAPRPSLEETLRAFVGALLEAGVSNLKLVAEATLLHACGLGLDETTAVPVVAAAMREVCHGRR